MSLLMLLLVSSCHVTVIVRSEGWNVYCNAGSCVLVGTVVDVTWLQTSSPGVGWVWLSAVLLLGVGMHKVGPSAAGLAEAAAGSSQVVRMWVLRTYVATHEVHSELLCRYGQDAGPFLTPMYGCGELPQVEDPVDLILFGMTMEQESLAQNCQ